MSKYQIAKLVIKFAGARAKQKGFDLLSWIGGKVSDLYNWTWYRCQWFVQDKRLRRPYTLIMRDLVRSYPYAGIAAIVAIGAGLGYLVYLHIAWIALYGFYWLLVGHVVWQKWRPGEQEDPEYLGKD